jgi:hypothetical protein
MNNSLQADYSASIWNHMTEFTDSNPEYTLSSVEVGPEENGYTTIVVRLFREQD